MNREIKPFIDHSHPLTHYYRHWFHEPGELYPFSNKPLADLIGPHLFWCDSLPYPPIRIFPEIPPSLVKKFHEVDPASFIILHGHTLYDRLTNPNYRDLNDLKNHPLNDLEIAVFSHLPSDQVNSTIAKTCQGLIDQDTRAMQRKFDPQYATRIFCTTHPASLSAPAYTQVQYHQDLCIWNYPENNAPKTNFYEIHPINLNSRSSEQDFWSLYLPLFNNRFGNGGILMFSDRDQVQYRLYSPFPTDSTLAQIHLSCPNYYSTSEGRLWSLPHSHRACLAAAFLAHDLQEPVRLASSTISALKTANSLPIPETVLTKAIRRDHACMHQAAELGEVAVYLNTLRTVLPHLA